MFKKILVAEDSDGHNIAVKKVLDQLFLTATYERYCDDAFLKIRKAMQDGAPYDLLITDLSFMPDHREARLASGEDLIAAIRSLQPELDIIVFSVEDRSLQIQSLFKKHHIAAYVFKGRQSIPQLVNAIGDVAGGKSYISPEVSAKLHDKSLDEIDDYDVMLLRQMAAGNKTNDIAAHFRKINLEPNSVSAIEKRINRLKISFGAQNGMHLVSLAKDLKVI
ncbi:hypothetical protein FNO01nite_33520 [Flavobacterium noncentrifugens]|uniref:DNA-binding response regulator, NarL/FixJ family, contains REC and HTH domains n=1 Tax=Flavobacterium noncentrifugens TaxID=1128970 RepID=A0A1G8Y6V7_9FLAO|nr:response regulator transcription factor [Flavobacterium noncentrifugens]GEP52680.1 hypothetical protein FNO01nite_33520 [Flavobacterium noncentrifugens]SDJ98463.1 DNA-binding response regulator, NarL/FixJ family, contains REC and HTH domains [Flavobacterium noncentrifugens]